MLQARYTINHPMAWRTGGGTINTAEQFIVLLCCTGLSSTTMFFLKSTDSMMQKGGMLEKPPSDTMAERQWHGSSHNYS